MRLAAWDGCHHKLVASVGQHRLALAGVDDARCNAGGGDSDADVRFGPDNRHRHEDLCHFWSSYSTFGGDLYHRQPHVRIERAN